MTDLETIILLNSCPKMHLRNLAPYLERYGSLERVFKEDPQMKQKCQGFDLSGELNEAKRAGIQLVSFMDDDYPTFFKQMVTPPLLLYVKGEKQLLKENLAIAMVGARRASPYGLKIAQDWARELVAYGVTVVSGLALGIDGAAHEGALRGKGKTVAVLGSGLGVLYPEEHRKLADRIAEQGGALISEFPIRVGPEIYHFPRRNRMISGLAMGVIVVEAGEKSGSLVTAGLALEQGKEVFAVPGRVDSVMSVGANRLLKDGARIALSVPGILEELALPILQQKSFIEKEETVSFLGDTKREQDPILKLISEEPISLEEIVRQLQQPVREVMSQLSLLELAGKVVRLPGPHFVKR